MVDVSKCSGEGCNIKVYCWRYTSVSGFNQSWIAPHYDNESESCDDFLDTRGE